MTVLAVRDLQISFGKTTKMPAVRNISFEIGANETLAVVGESGSGKSITALSIMRLLSKTMAQVSGEMLFEGRDLLKLTDREMRAVRGNDIAMIFQEPMTSLNPVLTAGHQIVETLRCHRGIDYATAKAEAISLLDQVHIPEARARFDYYPHQMSGGMRQRVMIALALACRPKLLIADEPTTALDVTVQAQILDLIKSLQAENGMSVLFITHDMGVVAEVADRALVMLRGDVVETTDAQTLFSRPAHIYTRALLSAAGRPETGAAPLAESRTPPVLSVRNLTTRFDVRSGSFGRLSGRVHAVENVSFDIAAGETLALVGESGCGKSTTGRSILKLLPAQSGRVTVEGKEVLGARGSQLQRMRQSMQIIFQDPMASLDPRMTVAAAISEPMLAHGLHGRRAAAARVDELLQLVGLSSEMRYRFPHEFSGGQRQRVCIARALAMEPRFIVADECVSALDATVKKQIVELLQEIQRNTGIAFLFISHDMGVVERISHRVAVMYMGEIVEIGPSSAVLNNPRHGYTRRLLSAVPVLDPARRHQMRNIPNMDMHTPFRSVDFVPPSRRYAEVSDGHFVLEYGGTEMLVPAAASAPLLASL